MTNLINKEEKITRRKTIGELYYNGFLTDKDLKILFSMKEDIICNWLSEEERVELMMTILDDYLDEMENYWSYDVLISYLGIRRYTRLRRLND